MAICRECGTGLDGTLVKQNSTERVQRFRAKQRAGVIQGTHGGRPITSKAWAYGIDDEHLYAPDELEFLKAMDQYKRDNRRPFPTWSEVFAVFTGLGYRKADLSPTSIHGHS